MLPPGWMNRSIKMEGGEWWPLGWAQFIRRNSPFTFPSLGERNIKIIPHEICDCLHSQCLFSGGMSVYSLKVLVFSGLPEMDKTMGEIWQVGLWWEEKTRTHAKAQFQRITDSWSMSCLQGSGLQAIKNSRYKFVRHKSSIGQKGTCLIWHGTSIGDSQKFIWTVSGQTLLPGQISKNSAFISRAFLCRH